MPHMRLRLLYFIIMIAFVFLGGGLFWTEIICYQRYKSLAWNNRVRLVPIEAPRGRILDRNGNILVDNRASFDVIVIPQELDDEDEAFKRLSEIVGIGKKTLKQTYSQRYRAPFAPIKIVEDISKKKAIILEEEGINLKGVFVRSRPKRNYRFGHIGSHIIGYVGKVAKDRWSVLRNYGYQMIDLVGKDGIEKYYNAYLKGENGGRQLEVDSRGRLIRVLGIKKAIPGRDLTLTVDVRLQSYIDEIFGKRKGAAIVMVPDTGEVLAMVSKPDYNPEVFINPKGLKERMSLLRDKRSPLLNRAIGNAYPPGSVFKPVVGMAGLLSGKVSPNAHFGCKGRYVLGHRVFRCWDEDGHGVQDLTEGLKNSCNVFFYQFGRTTGVEPITNYALKFGFGRPTMIDLPGEVSGLVPSILWQRLVRNKRWYQGDTLNLSIGQGYLLVTPLQIIVTYCAIANGGRLVRPYIVQKVDNVDVVGPKWKDLKIPVRYLQLIKKGLRKVVMDDTGTGHRARVEGLQIAGKTGTAQNPTGPSHAWFAGFSPIKKPKIAIVVFVEHGGKGGIEACELAREIFKKAKGLGYL